MRGRLDAQDIRAALRVTDVLDRFGVPYRDRPEIRLPICPLCGKRQRRAAFLVDRETGDCIHHSGPDASGAPCKSDIFGLTAALAGLDVRADFPRVLELAAEIAGVEHDAAPAELARRRAEYRVRMEAHARQAATERAAAEAMVPALWVERERRHLRGERYLADRGLDPAALRAGGDVVRFRIADGAPSVLARTNGQSGRCRCLSEPGARQRANGATSAAGSEHQVGGERRDVGGGLEHQVGGVLAHQVGSERRGTGWELEHKGWR